MACHMVAVPANVEWHSVGWRSNLLQWNSTEPENSEKCSPRKKPISSTAISSSIKTPWMRVGSRSLWCILRDTREESMAAIPGWLTYLTTVAGGAEPSYDWLGESAAWASMNIDGTDCTQESSAVENVVDGSRSPRVSSQIQSLQLSCDTTPTPKTPSSARAACSAHIPWIKSDSQSHHYTPRENTVIACAAGSWRGANTCRSTSDSSGELLTISPLLMLPPRLRGLSRLAQNCKYPGHLIASPASSLSLSPTMLVLELEQNVSVTNTKLENGIGLYEITWRDKSDRVHTVWRRYSDFSTLHTSLCNDYTVGRTVGTIPFPPKLPLWSFSRAHRERLLAERRDSLENYLVRLVLEGIVTPDRDGSAGEVLAEFLTKN